MAVRPLYEKIVFRKIEKLPKYFVGKQQSIR